MRGEKKGASPARLTPCGFSRLAPRASNYEQLSEIIRIVVTVMLRGPPRPVA